MVKEYGRHEANRIQLLIFVSACDVAFMSSIFQF